MKVEKLKKKEISVKSSITFGYKKGLVQRRVCVCVCEGGRTFSMKVQKRNLQTSNSYNV